MSLNVFRLGRFWTSRYDMSNRFVKLATHSTQWVRAIFDNVPMVEPFFQDLILFGNNQPLSFRFLATIHEPLVSSSEVYMWVFHSFGVFPMKCLVFPPCQIVFTWLVVWLPALFSLHNMWLIRLLPYVIRVNQTP